mgnify:FL=1
MTDYLKDLNKKEKELKIRIESKQLKLPMIKDTADFFKMVSEINSLSVDLSTVKSRIENYGRSVPHLPDSGFQSVINKYT